MRNKEHCINNIKLSGFCRKDYSVANASNPYNFSIKAAQENLILNQKNAFGKNVLTIASQ
jgi:hypothetical protein